MGWTWRLTNPERAAWTSDQMPTCSRRGHDHRHRWVRHARRTCCCLSGSVEGRLNKKSKCTWIEMVRSACLSINIWLLIFYTCICTWIVSNFKNCRPMKSLDVLPDVTWRCVSQNRDDHVWWMVVSTFAQRQVTSDKTSSDVIEKLFTFPWFWLFPRSRRSNNGWSTDPPAW